MNFFDPEYRIVQTIENTKKYVIQRRKWYSFFWKTMVYDYNFQLFIVNEIKNFDSIDKALEYINKDRDKQNSKKRKNKVVWSGR